MAGQDETMRLVAEVVDKTSGPIKKMGEAFKNLGAESEKAHTRGRKAAREHSKHVKELHERLAKVTAAFGKGPSRNQRIEQPCETYSG